MTLFTRILALLLVLGVVFAAPASMAASLVNHVEQSHECVDGCHGTADEHSGGSHDCPCACHIHVPVGVVVVPVPVSGPRVVLVDWLQVGDPLPVEGLLAGVEHPPQNA